MKFYTGTKIPVSSHTVLEAASPRNMVTTWNVLTPPATPDIFHGMCPQSEENFSGYTVPHFHQLVLDGWVIQNPMSKTTVINTANSGADSLFKYWVGTSPQTYNYHNTTGRFPVLQGVFQPLYSSTSYAGLINRARDEAVTRVFAKAQTGNADLLIDISQSKQLVQMLVKFGQRLLAFCRNPRVFFDLLKASHEGYRYVRIPPDGKRVPVDTLSGLWCELRFGWGPLLGTLNGIYEAAQRLDLNQSKRFTYRALEEINFNEAKSTTWTESFSWEGLVYSNQPWFIHDEDFKWRSTFRAGILLEQSISFRDALGLRLSAIPIAAWDLVPYSFIVDRFLNIGNWIRSLNPIPASSFGGAWVTEKYESQYQYRGRGVAYTHSAGSGASYRKVESASIGEAVYTLQRSGYVRTLVPRPPILPVLRHDWLQLNSLFNLLDSVFLAIQRFSPGTSMKGKTKRVTS